MPQIIQASNYNPANLQADDLYIVLQPPPGYIQGQPTDVIGIVGTASWGPLNTPRLIGNTSDLVNYFGPIQAAALTDARDIPTEVSLALIQAQNNFSPQIWAVRVSDGTDIKASYALKDTVPATGATATALYSGTLGNQITLTLSAGALTGTVTVTVSSFTGSNPEIYPNLPSVGPGVFWSNLANAVNNGLNSLRGPSQLIAITAPSGTAIAPALGTFALTLGTDGRSAVTSATQIGSDAVQPKTGMYALRNQMPALGLVWLCGNTDSTVYSTIQSFADTEGCLALLGIPSGTTSAAAISIKQTSGVNDPNCAFVKDWIYWYDATNKQVRLVPPMAVIGGRIAALAPQNSPSNKPVFGILGTERVNPITGTQPYSLAEIGQLETAGIMFVSNPCPGGNYFGIRHGANSSSSPPTSVVEYTRMTNFLAKAFGNFLGQYVGQNQTIGKADPVRAAVRNDINSFLEQLRVLGQIDSYQVICDTTNNTPTSIAQHFLNARVNVRYLSSIKFFVLTLQGGNTVVTIGNSAGDQLQQ